MSNKDSKVKLSADIDSSFSALDDCVSDIQKLKQVIEDIAYEVIDNNSNITIDNLSKIADYIDTISGILGICIEDCNSYNTNLKEVKTFLNIE